MIKTSSAAAATVALFLAGTAYAAHPLITDDAGTQGKGKFQLEVNGEYGSDQESSLGIETTEPVVGAIVRSVL